MKFRHAAVTVAIPAFPIAAQARSTAIGKAEAAGDTAPRSTSTVTGSASIASGFRSRRRLPSGLRKDA